MWVKRALIPKPTKNDFVGGYEILLVDQQNYYRNEAQQSYIETVSYVHEPSGLTPVGNLSVQWNPSREILYIHRVTIRRDKQVIDVLEDGQEFSVFQRERNLEAAFVDGIKTAALQIQGLMVGDAVNFSYSLHTKTPVITTTTSNLMVQLAKDAKTVRVRQVWPKHRKMKWEASSEMPVPQIRQTKNYHELIFDLSGLKKKPVGISAPNRFYLTEALAISDISNWSQISAEYAPFFERAAKIRYGSELYLEVEKIAKSAVYDDARAGKALQLVQQQIRYLYIGLNSGGYIPTSAEETWANKHGDCKDKTALLLALLNHLEIKAEPVLVSTFLGDELDKRLPVLRVFDHVIVRAIIFGEEVWLDGTQTGDLSIDRIETPAYKWGLPLRKGGSSLIPIVQKNPEFNSITLELEIDASNGVHKDLPVTGVLKVRGDRSKGIRSSIALMNKEQKEKWYESFWNISVKINIISNDLVTDARNGDLTFTMSGTINLTSKKRLTKEYFKIPYFSYYPEANFLYLLDTDEDRSEPWLLPAPYSEKFSVYIELPETTRRYNYRGSSLSWNKYGIELNRDILFGGSFLKLSRTIKVSEPEIFNKNARELIEVMDANSAKWASYFSLRKPNEQIDGLADEELETYIDYIYRGLSYLNRKQYQKAVADFSVAVEIDDASAYGFANRGLAQVRLGKFNTAEDDFKSALRIDSKNEVALRGQALAYELQGNFESAVDLFEQSLASDPSSEFARLHLIYGLVQLNRHEDAIVQVDEMLELYPSIFYLTELKATIVAKEELSEEFTNYIYGRRGSDISEFMPLPDIKLESVKD
ncbi:MAG: DUF3857 domain-containing protein [Robiginitomaculum sp.]|nr:DUF3857 domain-containing protein [Robiginitomaculum sp.]